MQGTAVLADVHVCPASAADCETALTATILATAGDHHSYHRTSWPYHLPDNLTPDITHPHSDAPALKITTLAPPG